MTSDIEIAQQAKLRKVSEIARDLGLAEDSVEYYGQYKAKIDLKLNPQLDSQPDGKLILVTAINPTPAGEGKSTVSVGLADGLRRLAEASGCGMKIEAADLPIDPAARWVFESLGLDPVLVRRYMDLTRDAVFYLDPHVCRRCRYRSTELLWQCPHCHEWNTFIEERIAPAKDTEATLTS